MKRITVTETIVQWNTIEVDDDIVFDPDNPEENELIRELMYSNAAMGWDGADVIDSTWEFEDVE